MKKYLIDKCMKLITKDSKYDEIKLSEIKYGLEGIYLNVSKLIVFLVINTLLGNFINGLIFLLLLTPIKSTSYGWHAKSSLQCWIISALGFILLPYLSKYVYFEIYTKITLLIIFVVFYAIFSPADTPKRPLVNKIKRQKLKISSIIIVLMYTAISLNIEYMSNMIMLVLFYQSMIISPLIYLISGTQYNNYLYYQLSQQT